MVYWRCWSLVVGIPNFVKKFIEMGLLRLLALTWSTVAFLRMQKRVEAKGNKVILNLGGYLVANASINLHLLRKTLAMTEFKATGFSRRGIREGFTVAILAMVVSLCPMVHDYMSWTGSDSGFYRLGLGPYPVGNINMLDSE
ncbi:hypothetical protein SADUNF_Sadunf09G0090300 [Salix dunnii]|uniref:Uncharacterized protein n=1 Tax=Salix dunnii TaxID=1413687 RepID=A0A835JRB9_9ROSI|nr:hypothetical protein SADUNF_Sadunf09G0090300 [Salix dunnii]